MCIMVYLGASAPLTLIPWDQAHPAFHVRPIGARDRSIHQHFAASHVFYVGAHEKCGCGFQIGDKNEELDEVERANRRNSLRTLSRYLNAELARIEAIEVHACMDGDQDSLAEHRRALAPDVFESETFLFREREHSVITKPT